MFTQPGCPAYRNRACDSTVTALEQAIEGEAKAIRFYTDLIELAADPKQRQVIRGIRSDEERHLNNFQAAYCRLTGHTYRYPEPEVTPPADFRSGVQTSFQDEQEAYEFYKANYFCNNRQIVKKAFFDASLDEAEHARWFNNFLIY